MADPPGCPATRRLVALGLKSKGSPKPSACFFERRRSNDVDRDQVGRSSALNELGISRSPKIRARNGVVVALFSRGSRSASLAILFDGNKRPTRVHTSYVELDGAEEKNK